MGNEQIELTEDFIVLAIPEETVEVTIKAKVFHDGELVEVGRTLGLTEVRDAFKEAQENYIPGDALFALTPLGEAYAEELILKQRGRMECEEEICEQKFRY